MIRAIASVVALSVGACAPEVSASEMDGQYLCNVQLVAVIMPRDSSDTYSGNINLPPTLKTFSIMVRPRKIDSYYCGSVAKKLAQRYDEGAQFRDYDQGEASGVSRSTFGNECLFKDEIVMNVDGHRWIFGSYDNAYKFFGIENSNWITIYRNGAFRMGDGFDSGMTVVEDGVCVKLTTTP